MTKLYREKHALWLRISFASFATTNEEIKSRLYEFSLIAFRHMKWLGSAIVDSDALFNYDRELSLKPHTRLFEMLQELQSSVLAIQKEYPKSVLGDRLGSDDAYLLEYIASLLDNADNNEAVTAFNKERKWPNKELAQEQIDALTLFLFEELYKEYELILVYNYMQAHTESKLHFDVFQDLIDESHFHFKSFGNMMAKLGILSLPRELHQMTYVIKDLTKFVESGIAEEEAAKEMCKALSASIKDEELSKFFDFINYQENYHIELMKKLL